MTARQQKALAALLTSPSKAAAAKAAGISPRTLRDYLADPDFQTAYRDAFGNMVEDATRQAQQAISPDAQARISAARAILSHGIKLTETTDILSRLQELEEAMEHGQ